MASWVLVSSGGSPQAIDTTLRYVAGVLGLNVTQPNANLWNAIQTFAAGANLDSQQIHNLANGTALTDAVNLGQVLSFSHYADLWVDQNGSDLTGTGTFNNPF